MVSSNKCDTVFVPCGSSRVCIHDLDSGSASNILSDTATQHLVHPWNRTHCQTCTPPEFHPWNRTHCQTCIPPEFHPWNRTHCQTCIPPELAHASATLSQVVATFTAEQQSQLLKFITACSRAPLLGFKYLEPGLCIQMAGSSLDPHAPDRLPTAATCMNLLKLPPYPSATQIRDKLLYAARNAGGFDLS